MVFAGFVSFVVAVFVAVLVVVDVVMVLPLFIFFTLGGSNNEIYKSTFQRLAHTREYIARLETEKSELNVSLNEERRYQ